MIKAHGTGNTFYIIDEMILEENMSSMAVTHCADGTDGVLFVCDSEIHLSKMRVFNADGSEPEMCGNGLRCFARYILEKHGLKQATIETLKASYRVEYIDNFHQMKGITIELYPVKSLDHVVLHQYNHYIHSEYICFNENSVEKKSGLSDFKFYTVSNPHIVGLTTTPVDHDQLKIIGKKANSLFPEGINVNVMRILGTGRIYVQTYERGVGITKSCGTGMTSASLHYAKMTNFFDQDIEVYNDGGMILCRVIPFGDDFKVLFTGNATYIKTVEKDVVTNIFKHEELVYQRFLTTSINAIQSLSLS